MSTHLSISELLLQRHGKQGVSKINRAPPVGELKKRRHWGLPYAGLSADQVQTVYSQSLPSTSSFQQSFIPNPGQKHKRKTQKNDRQGYPQPIQFYHQKRTLPKVMSTAILDPRIVTHSQRRPVVLPAAVRLRPRKKRLPNLFQELDLVASWKVV